MKTYAPTNPAQLALARSIEQPGDRVIVLKNVEELPDLRYIGAAFVLSLAKAWPRWRESRTAICKGIDEWAKIHAPRSLECRVDWDSYLVDIHNAKTLPDLVEMVDGLFCFFCVTGKEDLDANDLHLELTQHGLL